MDDYTCNQLGVVTLVKMPEAIKETWMRVVLDVDAAGKSICLYVEVLCSASSTCYITIIVLSLFEVPLSTLSASASVPGYSGVGGSLC